MCHSDQPGDGGHALGRAGCGGNMLASDAKEAKPGLSLKNNLTSLRATIKSYVKARRTFKGV